MDEQKAALRRVIRAQMKALAPEERRRSDEALFTRFLSLPAVERSDTLLLYCGMGAEPDTLRLLPRLAARGKRLLLPRCADAPGIMDARVCDPSLPLVRHRYGMLEPGPDRPVVPPGGIDLILVPGLAFDRLGYRLGQGGGCYDRWLADYAGQGGGYYDRYLPQTGAFTVALCRSCFLLDAVPREVHDAPVDLVLTEEETFAPSRL